ncbi:unnamed protein product [Brassica oleracea var. botrytis]
MSRRSRNCIRFLVIFSLVSTRDCGSDDPKLKLQKGDGEAVCGQFQKSIVIT